MLRVRQLADERFEIEVFAPGLPSDLRNLHRDELPQSLAIALGAVRLVLWPGLGKQVATDEWEIDERELARFAPQDADCKLDT